MTILARKVPELEAAVKRITANVKAAVPSGLDAGIAPYLGAEVVPGEYHGSDRPTLSWLSTLGSTTHTTRRVYTGRVSFRRRSRSQRGIRQFATASTASSCRLEACTASCFRKSLPMSFANVLRVLSEQRLSKLVARLCKRWKDRCVAPPHSHFTATYAAVRCCSAALVSPPCELTARAPHHPSSSTGGTGEVTFVSGDTTDAAGLAAAVKKAEDASGKARDPAIDSSRPPLPEHQSTAMQHRVCVGALIGTT